MSRAVLSLGGNVGDPLGHLRDALDHLTPWGGVDQDDFLNLVAVVADAEAGPRDWLERAWACERAADRTREVRWGPRTLDVDVLVVDDVVDDDPVLTLPHPRLAERAFVLVPWRDLEPDALVPGLGRTVAALTEALPPAERDGVHRRDDLTVARPGAQRGGGTS